MRTRSHQRLLLPLSEPRVGALVLEVAEELGWQLERRAPGRFVLQEDATKLHCHGSPIEVSIELSADDGETEVRIEGTVPGRGPISRKHVEERTDALTRKLGLAAIREKLGPASSR